MARRRRSARRVATAAVSVTAHLLVVAALWLAPVERPTYPPSTPAIEVMLAAPPPEPPPAPSEPAPADAAAGGSEPAPSPDPQPAPAAAAPVKTPEKARPAAPVPPSPRPSRPAPPSPVIEPLPVAAPEPSVEFVFLGESALAGAFAAGQGTGGGAGAGAGGGGSGGGTGSGRGGGTGGGCDMVRRLQDALRNDPRINRALTQAYEGSGASGRAILIWNGDWMRSPGQEGKGLAGVRQAIAVTVGFSPRACRAETVDGYVLLTLSDAPGAPRVAMGGGRWRWSDLLSL